MRLSRVHVAWAHGIDDSERAGTVNTHCWKVARVVFVSSDRGAQWANMYRGALSILELAGVWWFGGRAYSKSAGTCTCAICSVVRDTCVLITVELTVISPWLVFCLRLVRTVKGLSWVVGEMVSLKVASAMRDSPKKSAGSFLPVNLDSCVTFYKNYIFL